MRWYLTELRLGLEHTDMVVLSAHKAWEWGTLNVGVLLLNIIIENQLRTLICILLYRLFSWYRNFCVLWTPSRLIHVNNLSRSELEIRLRSNGLAFKSLIMIIFILICFFILKRILRLVYYISMLEALWAKLIAELQLPGFLILQNSMAMLIK